MNRFFSFAELEAFCSNGGFRGPHDFFRLLYSEFAEFFFRCGCCCCRCCWLLLLLLYRWSPLLLLFLLLLLLLASIEKESFVFLLRNWRLFVLAVELGVRLEGNDGSRA